MRALIMIGAALGTVAVLALLAGCGSTSPDRPVEHSFNLRPVLAWKTDKSGPCVPSTPTSNSATGTFLITSDASITGPDGGGSTTESVRICYTVGPAVLTKKDIVRVDLVDDGPTDSGATKREYQVILTEQGKAAVAKLATECTSGAPACPVTLPLGEPSGQILPMLDGAPACLPAPADSLASYLDEPLTFSTCPA